MRKSPANDREAETLRRVRRGLRSTAGVPAGPAMARAACFSRRQFHRLTLQFTGETPGAHQRRQRLDQAAWRLRTTRATILKIALESGFESHESFTRAFRRRFHLSPSRFRRAQELTLPRALRLAFSIAQSCQPHAKENP